MFSLTMHEPLAIRLSGVSKIYKLYGGQRDQLIDVLGLQRIGLKTRSVPKEFAALSDISLDIPRGHRIGVIGRNGAGKTTLLKLICRNYMPTSGTVETNGTVQALMNIGLGFHPDYTGRENVDASLQYNGLNRDEHKEAIDEIIDFCELGDFIDQPFKTYSLGMQARLMFASATAIRPDILIIDEVLGAGDAYFVAKSKTRVEKLVGSGCTMLLVTHSMQQILELCTEAIWLDQGCVRMQGEAFRVVKAYEEYMHGPIESLSIPPPSLKNDAVVTGKKAPESKVSAKRRENIEATLQDPVFLPHSGKPEMSEIPFSDATKMRFQAPGGISRWDSEKGLKITGFSIVTEQGVENSVIAMQPVKIVFFLVAEYSGEFDCRYGIAIDNYAGRGVVRLWSQPDKFYIKQSEIRKVEVLLNPNQIGSGEYTIGISVIENTPLETVNSATRYDLLSRSFILKVALPDSLAVLNSEFFHTAEWTYDSV